MSETLPPPIWVNTPALLRQMLADLSAQPRVAVDTESNSLHVFREQVCLIQFSSPHTDYLVDPLELTDLSALAPLFANPQIEKIFHAAEYDLICLRRDFHFDFANLFDTMQAARVLGYPAVGLDSLLRAKFEIIVDKRHQKANWGARPLTEDQIHYARFDTHYLFALRDALEQELIAADRLSLALEDFARACLLDEPKPRANGNSWERFAARKDLSLRELTALAELIKWRDGEAERLNRPPYKVVMDDMLIALAKNPPEAKEDLSAAGLSERQIHLWGGALLKTAQRGAAAPLLTRKKPEVKSDAFLRRMEKLKAWRKKIGERVKVESDVILPKPYLVPLCETPPQTLDDLRALMKESPTRVERYGADIVNLLREKPAS
ncbi:MAG: ribonuclease D [Anaerolineales bacterium]